MSSSAAARRSRSAIFFTIPVILAVVLAGAALQGAPGPARPPAAIDNADCFGCHGDATLETTGPGGKPRSLFVDQAVFEKSIHGKNRCTSCHGDIVDVPHPEGFRPKDVSCAQCHRLETGIYLVSDHGLAVHAGVGEAASCKDCHGATHTLLDSRDPASPVYRANITKTCARCHANAGEMEKFHLRQSNPVASYERSVHGLALVEKQAMNAAVCTDCHGSHDLHKSTNPGSKLYWQNVPTTCGKCHENVEQTYLRSVHGKAIKDGVRDAPVCTDCHGEHTIPAVNLPESRVSSANIPDTCGQCHAAQRIVTQYRLPPNVIEHLRAELPRPGVEGRQLRRRPIARPATACTTSCPPATRLVGQPAEPAADLRQVPSRHRHPAGRRVLPDPRAARRGARASRGS